MLDQVVNACSLIKVNRSTRELIQSNPHQVLNIKGKGRHIQLNSHKWNRWQELATLSQKGGNSVIQTLLIISLTYIMVKRKTELLKMKVPPSNNKLPLGVGVRGRGGGLS